MNDKQIEKESEVEVLARMINRRFDVIEEKIDVLQTDVSVLKEDVSVLKEDVSILKEDVSSMKEDISSTKEDVSSLKQGQKETNRRLDSIERKQTGIVLSLDETVHRSEFDVIKERVAVLES